MPVGERYFDAPTVFRRDAPTVFRRSHTDTYHLRKHVREILTVGRSTAVCAGEFPVAQTTICRQTVNILVAHVFEHTKCMLLHGEIP